MGRGVRASTVVRAGSGVLAVAAVLLGVDALLGFDHYLRWRVAFYQAMRAGLVDDPPFESAEPLVRLGYLGFRLVVAALLLRAAVRGWHGRPVGPGTVGVLGGVSLCCSGSWAVAAARDWTTLPATRDEVLRRMVAALPDWYLPVVLGIELVLPVVLLAALVLLLLPTSRRLLEQPGAPPSPPR